MYNESGPGTSDCGAETLSGSVVSIRYDRGYGFIRLDADGKDVFLHASECAEELWQTIKCGDRVQCKTFWSFRKSKYAACKVRREASENSTGAGDRECSSRGNARSTSPDWGNERWWEGDVRKASVNNYDSWGSNSANKEVEKSKSSQSWKNLRGKRDEAWPRYEAVEEQNAKQKEHDEELRAEDERKPSAITVARFAIDCSAIVKTSEFRT